MWYVAALHAEHVHAFALPLNRSHSKADARLWNFGRARALILNRIYCGARRSPTSVSFCLPSRSVSIFIPPCLRATEVDGSVILRARIRSYTHTHSYDHKTHSHTRTHTHTISLLDPSCSAITSVTRCSVPAYIFHTRVVCAKNPLHI